MQRKTYEGQRVIPTLLAMDQKAGYLTDLKFAKSLSSQARVEYCHSNRCFQVLVGL